MKIISEVYLHPSFEFGTANSVTLTDLPFMTVQESNRLARWVADVLEGKSHPGLNKPSWVAHGVTIKRAETYRKNNVWHYHAGPYAQDGLGHSSTDNTLAHNPHGKQSSQIYHYSKQGQIIIILGYSRHHVPFPDPNSRKNPLRTRANAWQKALPTPR